MAAPDRVLRRVGAASALMVMLAMLPEPLLAQAQPAPPVAARNAVLIPLYVPLFVDGQRVAEMDVLLDPLTGGLAMEAAPLQAQLAPLLTEARAALLRGSVDTRGMISLEDLRLVGVAAAFDEAGLRVLVDVPADVRAVVELSIQAFGPPAALGTAVQSATVSAFLNTRASVGYVDDVGAGPTPAAIVLDGALNVRGWAFENRGSWLQGGDPSLSRSTSRLVRDMPERALRLTVGDLSYGTRAFQSSVPLAGIAVARQSALQPYRSTRPPGSASFFLDLPSTVEFYVNDRLVRSMRLSPGPYQASSFPFVAGANDVRVVITDATGVRQEVAFPFGFEATLLNPGSAEFAYAVGIRSQPGRAGPEYEVRSPALSMFHRWGVRDWLTTDVSAQGDANAQMIGAGAVIVRGVNVVRADAGVSLAEHVGGYTARVQYDYQNARPRNAAARTWSLALRHISESFTTLGALEAPRNSVAWDASARYSQRLPFDLGLGVGIDYQVGRYERRDTAGFSVSLQRSFGRYATALRLRDRIGTEGDRQQAALVTVSVRNFAAGQSANATRDSGADVSRVDWRYTPPNRIGEVSGNASVERSRNASTLEADADYVAMRGTVGVSGAWVEPRGAGDAASRATLRASGALVYADGAFAFGRPVSEAFAILKPHPTLVGRAIGVDPVAPGVYQARIDRYGPAVLPAVVPYRVQPIRLDTREVPFGIDAGPGIYDIRTGYKQGALINVGTGATVFVLATVQTVDGTPVALQAARVVSDDDPGFEPVVTFTNRVGRLAVDGLRPGRYAVEIFSVPGTRLEFVIPRDAMGQMDIGALVLQTGAASAGGRQ